MKFFHFITMLFALSITTFAQIPDMGYYQLLNPNYDVGTDEEVMTKIQAMFIQQIFVQPLFNSTEIIEFDEDPIYDTKQSNELMNVIYARELSKYLAKQDLLNLNSYTME